MSGHVRGRYTQSDSAGDSTGTVRTPIVGTVWGCILAPPIDNTVEPSVCCLCKITLITCYFRPHRSTTYVNAAYCSRPSSVVCRSVCHITERCKNGCTDQDAVWVEDSGGLKEPCIRWGPDPPWEEAILRGERGVPLSPIFGRAAIRLGIGPHFWFEILF